MCIVCESVQKDMRLINLKLLLLQSHLNSGAKALGVQPAVDKAGSKKQ